MCSFYKAKCTKAFNESGAFIALGEMVNATLIPLPKKQRNKLPSNWSIEGVNGTIRSVEFSEHFTVSQPDYALV